MFNQLSHHQCIFKIDKSKVIVMARKISLEEVPSLVGQELGVTEWQTIKQDDINTFADLTGDNTWIHVDVERANRELGGTVCHGFLTLSNVPGHWLTLAEITGWEYGYMYGLDKTRWLHPVTSGDRIRLRATMAEPEQRNGGTIVTIKCVMEIEGKDKPALATDWREIFYTESPDKQTTS
ncbi:MAG: MaoC family dehydratase [Halieaceae bacterium]|nr:MaoC family dehydratase [Halieaceae bacterium]